jgi:hypothetical protein
MHPIRYEVSFRVHHPSIDPGLISTKLGLKPQHKWKAGADRKTPKGTPLKGVYETTYCTFRLKHSKKIDLADFLKYYNKNLFKHKTFLKSIRSTGGKLEYFIGWFSDKDSGEVFDLELLEQLVELKIDLSIAVYEADRNIE